MRSVTYFLALRYLWTKKENHAISVMVVIAGISIFIGSFSLTLVTAIMNGFEQVVYEKMQNIHPAATIYSGDPIAVDAVETLIQQEFPMVTAMSPTALGHVLVNASSAYKDQPLVIALQGVDFIKETKVSNINTRLTRDTFPFTTLSHTEVIIGKELAHQLNVTIGDTITLFYLEPSQKTLKKVAIEQTEATIKGIFETGIDEYDTGTMYCSLSFFESLFPDQGITRIGLSFAPNAPVHHLVQQISQRLALETYTWQDLYPALVSALVLEKYAMFFILLLITLVASMNIIALIFMLVVYKKVDIAILCSLGMNYKKIQQLFIIIGICLASLSTIAGIIGAWITSIIFKMYPFIQLPDTYYVSHLPAHMTITIAIIVFIVIISMAFIASWFATRYIKFINISHVLRYEG